MPNTYMNESGKSVNAAMQWFDLDIHKILILVDDMDLPLGKLRFRSEGGSGGHNGLKNIIMHLGTQNFCRLRIGIGPPTLSNTDRKQKTIPHVLGKFNKGEEKIINNVIDKIITGLDLIQNLGLERGITYLNTNASEQKI